MEINNIFTIGFRCNVDEFLIKNLNIRNYSSPFSYMLIDLETVIENIKNKFLNYVNINDIEQIKLPNDYKWYGDKLWGNEFFYNKKYPINVNDCIYDLDRYCIWPHHDLHDNNVIKSINTRCEHLLNTLENKSSSLLLFYIEKLQVSFKDIYFDISLLDGIDCNFLILIPILNFNKEPFIFYDNNKIKIIYFNASEESWRADINHFTDDWDKVKNIINSSYKFNIEYRI